MTPDERTAQEETEDTAPAPDPTADDLAHHRDDHLETAAQAHLRRACQLRADAAVADGDGQPGAAKTLRLLASVCERDAALAKAELWHRAAVRELMARNAQLSNARRQPRPGRRSKIRVLLDEAMKTPKREGMTFKELMRAWEQDVLGDGLRLHDLGDQGVQIVDENGVGGDEIYTRATLAKLYSQAR